MRLSTWASGLALLGASVLMGALVVSISDGSASDGSASATPSKIAAIRVSTDPGGGRLELYVVNADGSGSWLLEIARRVVPASFGNSSPATISYELGSTPAWSPDGRKIAFVGMRDDGNTDVYVVRADGLGQRRLTRHPGVDGGPAWSPDGRKIAFTRGPGDSVGKTHIYVMNADGSRQRRLARGHVHFSVAWSPDGQKMLFERPNPRHPGGFVPGTFPEDLHVMNADGSGQRNLTRNPARDGNPDWSPDGRRIAFWRYRRGGDVRVMNADGSGKRRLAPAGWRAGDPDWSPDGRKIAFAVRAPTSPPDGGIFVSNADGSERRRLTKSGGSPAWSPDGSKIAFGERDGGIYVMNADGSERRRLTQHGGSPSWSPDGEWIAYESGTPGKLPQEIWVMRPDGSGERMLMRGDRGGISQVLPWAWSPAQK